MVNMIWVMVNMIWVMNMNDWCCIICSIISSIIMFANDEIYNGLIGDKIMASKTDAMPPLKRASNDKNNICSS